MLRLAMLLATTSGLAGAAAGFPHPTAEDKTDYDKLAKEAAETFWEHLIKADFDEVIKAIEFPFLETGDKFDKAKDLRADLEITPKEEYAKTKVTVREVVSQEKFIEWAKKLEKQPRFIGTESKLRKIMDRIGKDGRYVYFETERSGEKGKRFGFLLLTFKGDKAWVVGMVD
jgi:hypothetical protein